MQAGRRFDAAHVVVVWLAASLLVSGVAQAQGGLRRADRIARRQEVRAQAVQPVQRQQLEQQLRRRLWQVTRERIGFTDAEMGRLEQVSQRFEGRRRELARDERAQRQLLRAEILSDDTANQDRIAAALDRMLQIQGQRHDLMVEEQKEFASFMTPLQRAKYLALQEQVRKRVEALRRQRPDSAAAGVP